MSTPRQFIEVLENKDAPAITERDAGGELLVGLLVHLFFSDHELADSELDLLSRLLGDKSRDDLRGHVEAVGKAGYDYAALASAYTDAQTRDDILTLAEHGVWADNRIEREEMDVLDDLVRALDIKRP